jgi:hypothetical protein
MGPRTVPFQFSPLMIIGVASGAPERIIAPYGAYCAVDTVAIRSSDVLLATTGDRALEFARADLGARECGLHIEVAGATVNTSC